MIKKQITSEWIDRFNEGLLNGEEIEQFNKQRAIDPLLRLETRMDAELNRLLADRDCLAFMDQLNSVMQKDPARAASVNLYILAAGVLLLLSVTTFLLYYETVYKPVHYIGLAATQFEFQPTVKQPPDAAMTQSPAGSTEMPFSGPEASPSDLLAESYQAFPELDMFAGSALRSALIWVRSPVNGAAYSKGEKIRFRWSGSMPAGGSLVILNNKGVTVYEKKKIDRDRFTLDSDGLPVGLLYWKIIEKDVLVAAGKIIVR